MNFLKKIGLKVKVALAAIVGVLGVIFYFVIRGKMRAKDQLSYELSRIKNEIEIAHLEKDTEENLKKIDELKKAENKIRKKIKLVEERETEVGDASLEELDDFFKNRGL
jgi:hypothetical protein